MTAAHYETLIVERRGPVGWLTFNRPERRNAVNARMFTELEQAWTELDADPDVRAIVNTGAGAAFQTGVDLNDVAHHKDELRKFSRQTRDATLRLTAWHNGVSTPVIAAVNGMCAGGGLHFVVDADLVIAAENAVFVDPHVSVGQVTAYEGIGLLRKAPAEPVFRLAFLGRHERMSAARAYARGIVGDVVAPEDLEAAAQRTGELIAEADPDALALKKRLLWNALETGVTAARQAAAHVVGQRDHAVVD